MFGFMKKVFYLLGELADFVATRLKQSKQVCLFACFFVDASQSNLFLNVEIYMIYVKHSLYFCRNPSNKKNHTNAL